MLVTSHLVRKYTCICSFRKYTFYCLGPLNFADVIICLQKLAFFSKKIPLLKVIVWELCSRFFTVTENITSADSVSGVQHPDCSKLAKNQKNDNDFTIFRHDLIVKHFWRSFVSLVKFSYWFKFYVNIVTGSGITSIFFDKGLSRNPEIWNIPVWVLPNIWRLGQFMDIEFGTNVFNMILLNVAKFQGCSSYRFWVIKRKPTGEG